MTDNSVNSLTQISATESPIRADLYSVERLEEYAAYLATQLTVDHTSRLTQPLLAQVRENGKQLNEAYRFLAKEIQNKSEISPAAKWLTDNFYIVEDQLREIREDLPATYYRELPKLTLNELAGYPRIYALALALIAHTDSRLEPDTIRRFMQMFQNFCPLTMGELWALPITLRLILVENLKRISIQVVKDLKQVTVANLLADQIFIAVGETVQLQTLVSVLLNSCGNPPQINYAFVTQMTKRLRDQEPEIWPALEYMDKHLSAQESSLEQIVNLTHQIQAAAQISVANIITSMRLLSTLQWNDFFESINRVDRILERDPASRYIEMDFKTRDQYRHVIERIAKATARSEIQISEDVVQLAQDAKKEFPNDTKKSHVGYYLIGNGFLKLEIKMEYRLRHNILIWTLIHPSFVYFSLFGLLLTALYGGVLHYSFIHGSTPIELLAIALLILIPLSELALNAENFFLTHLLSPRLLPKLDLTSGIPDDAKTLVVIPCMLCSETVILDLLEKLEIHHLRNEDPNLFFALLTDFKDSADETTPSDENHLQLARDGISQLNRRHGQTKEDKFYLFHRARKWNDVDNLWMGWERKRGKIHELNLLLRGSTDTSFRLITAPLTFLRVIRYVITLDSDTQLPTGSAKKLVGTILHPLNQPTYDKKKGRVTEGYAVLQPRIGISLESSSRSRFSKIFSGFTGIDPYTTAVSDVYQDLFGEGSYTGKGLYDVDAWICALNERAPENQILSHDLFEGLFARAALVTDIELLDDYPQTYRSSFERTHRWTRGDWQLIPWLWPFTRDEKHSRVRNQLPYISRWKLLDNLRRSLVAPTVFSCLILTWFALPGSTWFWTGLILLIYLFSPIAQAIFDLLSRFTDPRHHRSLSELLDLFRKSLIQFFFCILFLAHQSFIQVDAIIRVLYRSVISNKKMLEWAPAVHSETLTDLENRPFWNLDWLPEFFLTAILILFTLLNTNSSRAGIALILLWMSYPVVARLISRPLIRKKTSISAEDQNLLRQIARRTWHFFESFVGKEDHWLPVDNFQEFPVAVVAHRTSPTNIGLYLMALLSARDLGYISTITFLARLRLTLDSLRKMEQFEGHFYNWYDTRTLKPLIPKYVSTVDSGNLAGYLLTLRQACLELPDQFVIETSLIQGLKDTLTSIRYELIHFSNSQLSNALTSALALFDTQILIYSSQGIEGWLSYLNRLTSDITAMRDRVQQIKVEHPNEKLDTISTWIDLEIFKIVDATAGIRGLAPWVKTPSKQIDFQPNPTFATLLNSYQIAIHSMKSQLIALGPIHPETFEITKSLKEFESAQGRLEHILEDAQKAADEIESIFVRMNFKFLVKKDRGIFSIGYNVGESELDSGLYDLLASEARLAVFVAVAKGDAPQEYWLRLGRRLVPVGHGRALISWSASMFEYLMPLLVMQNYENTLLGETLHSVVKTQIGYGKQHNVPWGISEAGYNARDLELNYQYGPFGIPGLGLKRGLGRDLVISPYSTCLATMVDPTSALKNLKRLMKQGLLAVYGFYESVDYTVGRQQENETSTVIRSFMAHHQGMSLVAINNVVNDCVLQSRFHADPRVRANRLLLQERVPQGIVSIIPKSAAVVFESEGQADKNPCIRQYGVPSGSSPHIQLLSNRNYSVMISTSGAGYSKLGDQAMTRWKEDSTRDHWGSFIFVRDLAKGAIWSSTYQPIIRQPDSYRVTFSEEKAEFFRTDGDISTHTQILVAPEDNVEIRHVTLINHSTESRELEVTSYLEPVLESAEADSDHLAFSKLFVQTEYWPLKNTLLAKRRPRSEKERESWGLHVVVTDGILATEIQYETDRSRFIGRGRTLKNPAALELDKNIGRLSNTSGATLDPILALRAKVHLRGGEKVNFSFTTGITATREKALELADRYHDIHSFERERKLAWIKSQVDLRHLNIDSDKVYLFQRLAERILFLEPSLRPPSLLLETHMKPQSSLWPHGISGDVPIVTLRIDDQKDMGVMLTLLRCHEYLRLKGLIYDFVILNEQKNSYFQALQEDLLDHIRTTGSQGWLNKKGGIFILRCGLLPDADSDAIQAMARVSLVGDQSLKEQINRKLPEDKYPPLLLLPATVGRDQLPLVVQPQLEFFNGFGGFSKAGAEYVILLRPGQWTPAPWINVIANRKPFGFQISETGSGFTWSINSQTNRLTSWSNDPVSDPSGEIIYLRDDETGEVWTPTPLPIRENANYTIKHGQGYSQFEYTNHGIHHLLTIFVPKDDSIKISLLELKNLTQRKRLLSIISYTEWVLGSQREKSAPHLICDIDKESGAIFSKNLRDNEFTSRVAFADLSESDRTFTCSRTEFIGRHGNYANPAALKRRGLSQKKGTGRDPCAALQTTIELNVGCTREVAITLGQADHEVSARQLAIRYRDLSKVKEARDVVIAFWKQLKNSIQIRTPDPAMNILFNHWLLYQTLSCRFWARSAFYQSGGAYGFRDQLQDCMALIYSVPQLSREHILRAASRQFREGDVQHWWHPPNGRGIRTRISDDLLWLPYVVSFYVNVTGDRSILTEPVHFLDSPLLKPEEEDSYTEPGITPDSASLFEHCVRAIEHSLGLGSHDLPFIGTGDWNDGMNRVGNRGRGESVWMGWFLYKVLTDFLPFCDQPELKSIRENWGRHQAKLKNALNTQGWDGQWYKRAFFDDGQPLGSAANDECQIDSIAQSWSVLSGAGDPSHTVEAMDKLFERLVDPTSKLILVLAPPFEKSLNNPGYIMGYVPGVRENGGQYTHAAVWAMMAFAKMGNSQRAFELFSMLNPIHHAETQSDIDCYKTEPYVLCGDIYSGGPLEGRGGWSWYTGSSSWYYRGGLESILGFILKGNRLTIKPCIPTSWKSYEIIFQFGKSKYTVLVNNPIGLCGGNAQIDLDGAPLPTSEVILLDDEREHQLTVTLQAAEQIKICNV